MDQPPHELNSAFAGEIHFRPEGYSYSLLPFRFCKLDEHRYVATNLVGEHLVVSREEIVRLIRKQITPECRLYDTLKAAHFLVDQQGAAALELLAAKYRTKQAPLADFTSLHMFVPTLRCNNACIYCQVSRKNAEAAGCDMSREIADKAIEFVFRSPSARLKVEFQGGEPLLNFEMVRYIVEKTKERAQNRPVEFVICSNLALVDDDILTFCRDHEISFSTSLDGPRQLHNANRPSSEFDSYSRATLGIQRVIGALGRHRISALMTTTRESLEKPVEIVDEYLAQGLRSIFLRPINPYGFASSAGLRTQYTPEEWLEFYKTALAYILKLNKSGICIREEYTALLLRRMLTPFGTGYVDLQSPAGIGISAIVFNHDGRVYASDESRMVGEMGDHKFCLGNLLENTYEEMMLSDHLLDPLMESIAECVPGCCECAFLPYCGSDPVRHYRLQGDVVGNKAMSEFCQRHMGMFRHLIALLQDDVNTARILKSWL